MEIDKQFKCSECDSKFATIDHLHAHQRRHDMSLNFSRYTSAGSSSLSTPSLQLSKGSLSAGIIGFTDETPTPTRFIKNCEEVGLFQDLQNVNPFDEDFKKAANSASATPSGDETFEFTFSASVVGALTTPNVETAALSLSKGSKSKRRYSDQDTLNTPQVFPYVGIVGSTAGCLTLTTNTASMSACLTPTPQHAGVHQEALRSVIQNQSQAETQTASTTYNHEEHVSIIAYTSAISHQTGNKNEPGSSKNLVSSNCKNNGSNFSKNAAKSTSPATRTSLLKIRSKSNLKLDLKTVMPRVNNKLEDKHKNKEIVVTPTTMQFSDHENKKELLERNRAAAHRSRERRKQWIYGLESRCRALETLLAQSQAEVVRLKTENGLLRSQLNKHSQTTETIILSATSESNVALSETEHSIVVHEISPRTNNTHTVIQEPLVENMDDCGGMVATIVSPIVLPTVKSKRGRPRKGEERRVPILAVPISTNDEVKIAPKIPILPVSYSISRT